MEECYRCDKAIVALAKAVIEQDVDRLPKEWDALKTAEEGAVTAYRFQSISAEARGIASLAEELVADGVAPESILVLLRNDPQAVYSNPLIEAMATCGIHAELAQDPYAVLDEETPRLLVCFLRLLDNDGDSLAWRELLMIRRNGVGGGTLDAVYELADELGITYATALFRIVEDATVFENARSQKLADEVSHILQGVEEFRARADEGASSAIPDIIAFFQLDESDEAVSETVTLLSELTEARDLTLQQVRGAIQAVKGSYSETETSRTGVQIMTMHAAKGLTAAVVFIPACEDELIPGRAEGRREIDDERRLLYVSLTRAQHRLILTYATRRAGRQSEILQISDRRTFTSFLADFVRPAEL